MAGWERLQETVQFELVQRGEEGCKIEGFADKLAAAGADEIKLMQVYNELMELTVAEDFPYEEPSSLEEIRRLRPEGPRKLQPEWSGRSGETNSMVLGWVEVLAVHSENHWSIGTTSTVKMDARAGRILSCGSEVRMHGQLPAIHLVIHGQRKNMVLV